jgi:insulysin
VLTREKTTFATKTEEKSTLTTDVERIPDALETPFLDDRSYRVIRLPNKLEILLIHNPDTDKAAAAMDVNVGSFSDQDDLPGTAHAVEHLCFMGTKKVSEDILER